jgi:hypothetical protein
MKWIPIDKQLPPIGKPVLFCCEINDDFTKVEIGEYMGKWTDRQTAVVMDVGVVDDWLPCSHWMPVPKTPGELDSATIACWSQVVFES